jgi:hypothetical protein
MTFRCSGCPVVGSCNRNSYKFPLCAAPYRLVQHLLLAWRETRINKHKYCCCDLKPLWETVRTYVTCYRAAGIDRNTEHVKVTQIRDRKLRLTHCIYHTTVWSDAKSNNTFKYFDVTFNITFFVLVLRTLETPFKVKVKFALEQALKVQRGSRGIALVFL